MAGTVQRLYGNGVTERFADTKSLNIRLAVIGAVLPVTVGIDGQGTVIAVEAGTGELILPGIHISDTQCTGDGQHGTIVFADHADIGAGNYGGIIGAVDGDGQFMTGAIHRLDGNGVNQRIAIAQGLNGSLTAAGAVIPDTGRVQGN